MLKRNWILSAIIICFTSQFIYSQDLTQEFEFMYDDSMRSCIVYEPNLDPNQNGYPLVVGFHGGGAQMKGYSFIGTAFLIPKAKADITIQLFARVEFLC